MERKRMTVADSNNVKDANYYEQNMLLPNLHTSSRISSWKDDKLNIFLLYFLYVLQGIPLGLGGSIPLILQNRHVSYKQQALFSFVNWPFSLKLLWAPVVDSAYCSQIGRRKTWLIPAQYLIGFCMIVLSNSISSLLGDDSSDSEPNVTMLTAAFFFMNILAATQDIAVDGWALTMLSRHNVGYASTCNSVGQTTGYFLGNVVFLALESPEFCNSYLRYEPKPEGIVTVSSFLMLWGYIFFIATTLVAIFKREKIKNEEVSLGIVETYKMLFRTLCLRNILMIIAVLMTCKIGFAATDAATGLKLIEAGVPKEHIALMAIPLVPLQILLPLLISKYTAGPSPLGVFLKAYPYRLLCGLIFAVLLWWTQLVKLKTGGFPMYYYIVIITAYAAHQVTLYSIFVALMAFFAKISDPAIGGTYMTLLNTICNLGGNWPATLALWSLDLLTFKSCQNIPHLSCDTKEIALKCEQSGGHCVTRVDGYYIETVFCTIFGFVWLKWGRSVIQRLQQAPSSSWTYS